MEQFLSDGNLKSPVTANDQSNFRDRIEACLISRSAPSGFRLRLAGSDDLDDMFRLVNGLAVFEKEPDAVNVTIDHYHIDGFTTEMPLFYCLLMDYSFSEDDPWYACGLAFCYVGCTYDAGRFLYLEDLFLEEAYRGKGGGTYIMRTLAATAVSLDCCRLVWQALDWNTPAVEFYNKLGAKVVEGLLTARFAGPNLEAFSSAATDE